MVGGGVVGCAIARSLADVGASVHLLEARECGSGASWAAAGMLSPYGEVSHPGPFLDLAVASMAEYPEFVARLERDSGRDLRFTPCGKIEIAHTADRAAQLADEALRFRREGVAARLIEPGELVKLEPGVEVSRVVGALLFPDDAHVDNRALALALPHAARQAGVIILEQTPVIELVVRSGTCVGVRTADGSTHAGDLVVLAAGAQAAQVRDLPRALPIEPVLGEMIAYPSAGTLRHMLHSEAVYVIQRGSRLLVGATMERGETSPRITTAARDALMKGVRALLPSLSVEPVEQWAGLRPATPDGLPILGSDPSLPGLAYACGHFRNGILLVPATAAWAPTLIAQPPSSGRLREINWNAFSAER